MSSNPRGEHAPRSALRSPRSWSLRTRLIVTQVVLLAVVCAGIGVATEYALQRFLINQLDEQVIEAGRRSSVIFEFGPPPPPGIALPVPPGVRPPLMPALPFPPPRGHRMMIRDDQGPGPAFLNAPGQAILTVGAVVADGRAVEAGIITADGSRAEISAAAAQQLTSVAVGDPPQTVDLTGLGRYRVVAFPSHLPGEDVVAGLPTSDVDDTLFWVAVIFCAVAAVALLAAGAGGVLIVRRQLAPLARVSTAAQQVADLELDRGEVRLPTPIVEVDPAASHTEVGQLGSALNRMLDRIAGALSARHASETRVRQFVADASHELRTPLAAIRGYTELAQRKRAQLPDDVAHAMNRVESETHRMTQLVEDMLLLARLDDGRPLQRDSVDLSRLVVDAVSDAHIAGPDHVWELDLPEAPVTVPGDEARLHQVLANLLANARTHTPAGTTVTTSLAVADDGDVVLGVLDDGPGIPAWLQPDVFERFARGDTSRSRLGESTQVRPGGSTGLGLAIVAAVVRAHGGTIDLHSVPGRTEFTVRLPPDSQRSHSPDQSDA
ncbi:two-component system OmpR family sensor kinase [Mycolicibacterium iranicum]|uniref:histidine kinase n=1 Tax=Mycolicibacterium iranicum TaxID=912594 RepID=A0A839QFT7_MYCIR|nr:HAMP domain-containing sensor histidine kinase [Mycolicibacterium iranicum]MBB2993375.1 two-component system OmpR family sensor kinase [Mycolicibacterium iranicum]